MDVLKDEMIEEAIKQHGEISPVALKNAFNECFTIIEDRLFFWFNDCTGSTRVIIRDCICRK